MEFLTSIASGSGIFGSLIGSIAGIATAFVKLKTLKENNRHSHSMSLLAGKQEVARANAALELVKPEGAIQTDLAIEDSLQKSFEHDAAIGSWLKGRELGPVSTAVMILAEFVRMMMRPVLTCASIVYVFLIFDDYMDLAGDTAMSAELLAEQITMVGSAIILLATTAFTWWFADRSVSKALTKKLT